MVKVIYRNRLGNRLFQYCFGRIVAESLGWQLQCKPLEGFPGTREEINGENFPRPIVAYCRDAQVDLDGMIADRSPRCIVLNAWFQRYSYYRPFREAIRRWLSPESPPIGTFPLAGPKDLLLHLRLGTDYERRRWVLHPEFYHDALARIQDVEKVYVCYDIRQEVSQSILAKCLTPFLQRGAILFQSTHPLADFNFARQFHRIAIAPSTFCWWSAYLSHATTIFFPDLRRSATSCWRQAHGHEPRLEVDEARYVFLPARTLWDA